jgi:butyrate kinase
MKVLVINPGSTSTKIAVYDDERVVFSVKVEHGADVLARYPTIAAQYPLRLEAVKSAMSREGVDPAELSAVSGRGGHLPPVRSGAYRVNAAMVDRLEHRAVVEHAANLGAIIAFHLAEPLGIPAFIYDPITVDELEDIARLSGLAEIERKSAWHALNGRAVAMKCAAAIGRPYPELNLIVAHLGGGTSISVHRRGRVVDMIRDDEGAFSPERAGRVPCGDLVELCYTVDRDAMRKKLRGSGGLVSYLGTSSALEIEGRIAEGDARARLVYEAMAYQAAKGIGDLATVVSGDVDGIALTGGIAGSELITAWIRERVEFIAPVHVFPGENELEALARGALRVLRGEETAHEYDAG